MLVTQRKRFVSQALGYGRSGRCSTPEQAATLKKKFLVMLCYLKNRKSNLRCTLPFQHWCSLRHTTDTQHTSCYCCGYHWDVQYVFLEFLLLIDANENTSKGIWKKSDSLLLQKLKPVFYFLSISLGTVGWLGVALVLGVSMCTW